MLSSPTALAADSASAICARVNGSKNVVPFADCVVAASPAQAPA